ncbi:hypothetical protein GGR58DRAFT_508842 [Xylaria digitata]|nr:hypothetical protein GGR58DRAFT_508842 [Xylaria digitata]
MLNSPYDVLAVYGDSLENPSSAANDDLANNSELIDGSGNNGQYGSGSVIDYGNSFTAIVAHSAGRLICEDEIVQCISAVENLMQLMYLFYDNTRHMGAFGAEGFQMNEFWGVGRGELIGNAGSTEIAMLYYFSNLTTAASRRRGPFRRQVNIMAQILGALRHQRPVAR